MKGYMIFVEGKNAPSMVYETFQEAHKQAQALALKERGKEVYLLQIHKRFVKKPKINFPIKLGTHLPENPDNKKLRLSDMVLKESAKVNPNNRKTEGV